MLSISTKQVIRPVLLFSIALFSQSSQAGNDLRFGISGDYPPYEFRDKNNELVGFDIQVAQSICNRLNKNCVFIDTPWDDLISGLSSGKYDAIISALSPNPERMKLMEFTDRYMVENGKDIAIAVSKGASKLKKDLNASIKAIKSNGDLQSAFDRYFPGKTNPLAGELAKLASAGSEKKNPNADSNEKSSEIMNTPDGFHFRAFLTEEKMPAWEAFGGPCRPMGIQGMGGRIDDALAASKPDYRTRYAIRAYSYLAGTSMKVAWSINWNVDWQSTLADYKRKYEYAKQNGLPAKEVDQARENTQMAECLSMNYIQYVIALENWSKKNKKELQKMWDTYINRPKT